MHTLNGGRRKQSVCVCVGVGLAIISSFQNKRISKKRKTG